MDLVGFPESLTVFPLLLISAALSFSYVNNRMNQRHLPSRERESECRGCSGQSIRMRSLPSRGSVFALPNHRLCCQLIRDDAELSITVRLPHHPFTVAKSCVCVCCQPKPATIFLVMLCC